ncbi:hypothetical protein BKA24_001153 [Microbacterium marinum]|uniref:DUF3263 domain-containing protein n=1 Tax=Microbacterium marinum TaxID=421115 RepID=A0A7W7FKJ7_9MICO|nr:DUF3263 domain-containing protein [Microbacterium marinum]MBB4666444.1 hypothetical protein [Microbacterium marinum]
MPTAAELLDFEATHPGHPGSKVHEIEAAFDGMPAARYYQLLVRAADAIEGQARDPVTAHRVTRLTKGSAALAR